MAVLLINRLGYNVTGGEEQYLAFAHQFFNPGWIPGSFTYSEFAGTRIVFQWLVGPVMEWWSFEQAAFWLRAINFTLLSVSLAYFFRATGCSAWLTFIICQAFLLSAQNLFGGEWIIKSFEPKSVAYIFAFSGLYAFTRKHPLQTALWLVLASSFHILVGGWTMLALLLLWTLEGRWKNVFSATFLFGILMLPMVIYLYLGYFHQPPRTSEFNPDWIYCYYRLSHHLGIWRTTAYFVEAHALGAFGTLFILSISFAWNQWLSAPLKRINRLMQIIFAINLLFVGIAAMDHYFLEHSGGLGLKYYPFRSNSIGFLLAMIILFRLAFEWLQKQAWKLWAYRVVIAATVIILVVQGINNVNVSIRRLNPDEAYLEMCQFITDHTKPTATFLLLHPDNAHRDYNSFGRRTARENFVVPKFVSAEKGKLIEWYERIIAYNRVRQDLKHLNTLRQKHRVDYLLTGTGAAPDSLELVHENDAFKLYRLRRDG